MTSAEDETHPPSRVGISVERRLELIERDIRDHASSLTALVAASQSFTVEQMEQLRTVFREEMADAGLRIDGPDHVDDSRRDFMFLRSLRRGMNGISSKIGWAVILAMLGGAFWVVNAGLTFWKTH